jgi:hypothetical protein
MVLEMGGAASWEQLEDVEGMSSPAAAAVSLANCMVVAGV